MRSFAIVFVALVVAQSSGAVTGVVVDSSKQQPIAGASVLLVRPDAPARALFTTTDDLGRFEFAHPVPGAYRLRAERDDFVRGDLSAVIEVSDGSSSRNVLMLTPAAVISGRVTDQNGEPASRVFVRAFTGAKVAAEARTNDLGEYRLFGLPPDAYVISAERYPGPRIENNSQIASGHTAPGASLVTPTPPCPDCLGEGVGWRPLQSVVPTGGFIDPRALTGEAFPTVFYPGTTDRSAATPIKAGAGAQIEAIDLTLVVNR